MSRPDLLPVAIVQARAPYLDLEACLDLVDQRTLDAANNGARLVAFGETFLPGYPAWLDVCSGVGLWDHEPTKQVFEQLHRNSVRVPGPVTQRLSETAARHGIVMVIGINEKVESAPGHGTLYNALLTFDGDGQLVNHHRKLVPTFTEKLVWGPGDGAGLQPVDTQCGRVGALVCWEHWMPLARQALHNDGEQIHVAAWPTVKEMMQVASRHYAFEGRCFVLASGTIMPASDIPAALGGHDSGDKDALVMRGGSGIIAPDGRYLAGPVYDEETILYADLDLTEITRESMTLDTTGHYYRDDVFDLAITRSRR